MSNVESNVLHIVNILNNGLEDCMVKDVDGNAQTAFDYLQDVLDFNWILNSDRTLKGARLLVAFGGPNIWIDTTKGIVEGYWWQDKFEAEYDTNSEFARDLDDALKTLFNC